MLRKPALQPSATQQNFPIWTAETGLAADLTAVQNGRYMHRRIEAWLRARRLPKGD